MMNVISRPVPETSITTLHGLFSLICQLDTETLFEGTKDQELQVGILFFLKSPESKGFACHILFLKKIAVKNAKIILCPDDIQN